MCLARRLLPLFAVWLACFLNPSSFVSAFLSCTSDNRRVRFAYVCPLALSLRFPPSFAVSVLTDFVAFVIRCRGTGH